MKKIYLIILSLLLTTCIFAQPQKEINFNVANNEIQSRFANRKEKGYYYIMQFNLLFGNSQKFDLAAYNSPYSTLIAPDNLYSQPNVFTTLTVFPSTNISNGYKFNEHWAAGAGLGFEIFDHNLFPLFGELRYTLWDYKISPFVTVKGGYSFGSFKAKHYDELYLKWIPYHINDAKLTHFGGLMLHPEIGVKIPLDENSDLLFTVAYRYQKTKSIARKEYEMEQFDEWEHNEDISRLSFGIAIMFR